MAVPRKATKKKQNRTRNAPIKVFISYTQDSSNHNKRVLDLANQLRKNGFDCDLDQYHANQDWPVWMERNIEQAKFVLVVCTPTYRRRWNNDEKPGVGLGAQWESLLTRQHLYLAPGLNDKFIPVLFKPKHISAIPTPLTNVTRVDLSREKNFVRLLRRLHNIPPAQKPPISTSLAPFTVAKDFFSSQPKSGLTLSRPKIKDAETFDHTPFGLVKTTELLFSNLLPVSFPSTMQAAKVTVKRTVKFNERLQTVWKDIGMVGKVPVDFWIEAGVLYRFSSFDDVIWKKMFERKYLQVLPAKPTSDWASSQKMADKNCFIKLLNRSLEHLCSHSEMIHDLTWSKQMRCYLFVPKPGSRIGKLRVKALVQEATREVYKAIRDKISSDKDAIQHWQHQAFRHNFVRYGNEWFLNIVPFWAFTSDGRGGPSRWQNSSSANMRRPEKNRAVLGHVMFWASVLCREPDLLRMTEPFAIHRPLQVAVSPAINDHAWIKIAKDEDKQSLVADLGVSI